MAKNRTMAIKHAKAKKCAIQEAMDNAKHEMCCKSIPKNIHIYENYYSTNNSVFYSKYAIQKRIDVFTGRHYPAEEFREKYNSIYEYLITHTIPEARRYFGIISIT